MPKPVFVIGDVHGHIDRLEALLMQEGIIGHHEGQFQVELAPELGDEDAPLVSAISLEYDRLRDPIRINHDVEVVQLGDLGHWGGATGSPTGDRWCWEVADDWLDLVLWGNHDRALVDPHHAFAGYQHPGQPDKLLVNQMHRAGRLRMAHHAHGYLIVHAGVALGLKHKFLGMDAALAASLLNGMDAAKLDLLLDTTKHANEMARFTTMRENARRFKLIDAIGRGRGGGASEGGVLWMDWFQEKHLQGDPFKYICGHTAQDAPVRTDEFGNWCIDIGTKDNGRLAGLWLEEGEKPRPVEVQV